MSRSSGQSPVPPPSLRKPRPWRYPVLTGLRRPISVVAALAVMVPVALAAANVQAATGRQAVPAASQAPQLARAVADARTTGARVAAIDHMMAALHIDVINPANGAVVVPGAARSLTDAYLYTGEVERLAAGYATRQRFTLAGLAANLNVVYSKLRVRLTAASLGAAVLKVTQADARNGDSDAVALLPRLVRQLGLLDHPAQDLAKKIAVARVRLDPLQAWLVEAAFSLPLVYANPVPAPAASLLPAMTDGVVKRVGVSDSICDDLKPLKKTLIGTAQYAETAVLTALGRAAWAGFLKTAGKYVAWAIDIAHEFITGTGVTVTDTVSPAETYLSGGPDLHFTVTVFMHYKLHPLLVRCGWLSGDVFPGYGPVKGVDVSWDNSELAPWGSFSCDRVGCDKTGTDGQARETFAPSTEDVHRGVQIYERGLVHAIAFVGSSLGNKVVGTLGDLLRVTGGMAWEVRHHKTGYPTGFTAHVKIGGGSLAADVTVTGAVKQPKSTWCAPGGCTYEVQNITGTVTSLGNNCGTVSVPPFKIVDSEWRIATVLSGGKYVQEIFVTILFTTGNSSCSVQYLVAIDDQKPSGQYPVYEFGETNSTVNLAYPGQGTGVATITWAY